MPVRGSDNYVWFEERLLGESKKGKVYYGRHKRQGTVCAIKVFPETVDHAEHLRKLVKYVDVIKALNHENILVNYDAESGKNPSHNNIIVMEYCSEGSLADHIDKIQNFHGLTDKEFLRVFHDVTAGMKFLFEKNISHNDLTPHSIFCNKREDGQYSYKIGKFDSACHTSDAAYMTDKVEDFHSSIYCGALIGKTMNFKSQAIDLWSFARTLHICATGSEPFRSDGGESIFPTILKKLPIHISYTQKNDEEPQYNTKFPSYCPISAGLSVIVLPALTMLMNKDIDIGETYKQLFIYEEDAWTREPVYVYDVGAVTSMTVYLHRNANLKKLTDELERQKKIRWAEDSTFFYKGNCLAALLHWDRNVNPWPDCPIPWSISSVIGEGYIFARYAHSKKDGAGKGCEEIIDKIVTTINDPLLAYSQISVIKMYVQFPDKPEMPPVDATTEADSKWAHSVAALVHIIGIIREEVEKGQTYTTSLQQILISKYRARLLARKNHLSHLKRLLEPIHTGLVLWMDFNTASVANMQTYTTIEMHMKSLESLRHYEEKISEKIKTLLNDVALDVKHAQTECQMEKCSTKMETFAEATAATDRKFKNDKTLSLSYNEEQIHKYDRIKQDETLNKTIGLFNGHCLKSTERSFQSFLDWCREDRGKIIKKTDEITTDLKCLRNKIEDLQVHITNAVNCIPIDWETSFTEEASEAGETSEASEAGEATFNSLIPLLMDANKFAEDIKKYQMEDLSLCKNAARIGDTDSTATTAG